MKRLILVLFFMMPVILSAQDEKTDILFMGNSYTYFWNLPQLVQAMSEAKEQSLLTRQSTAGGANLGEHWKHQKFLKSRDKLNNGNWDYVVLQDHSMRSIQAPDSLRYYVTQWSKEIKSHGAQPVLYMTWARDWNPLMTKTVASAYRSLAKELNIDIVPVGELWAKAKSLRPDLELYDKDQTHPSPVGAYLTACAFYKHFTQESPVGLPSRLMSKDQFGEKIYLSIIPQNDALFLQELVELVMSK